ncbi:hypothetical protein BH11PSE2_BH11PSE2_17390 [soil metagenome]
MWPSHPKADGHRPARLRERLVIAALSLTAGLAMSGITGALAADTPAKPPETNAQPAKVPKPKEKLICTTEEVTGSLMRKRVCRTEQQIEAERRATEDLKNQRQGSGAILQGDKPLTP